MKRTLLFTLDFAPRTGGVARYYKNICAHLPFSEIFVLAGHEEQEIQFDKEQPYKIYRDDIITKLPVWPKWIFSIFKLHHVVKKEKIEFILVGNILPLGTIALLYKKIFKTPYGVFIHGLDLGFAKKEKRKYRLALMILENASFIAANSNYTKKLILEWGIGENKVKVVYPGVEISTPKREDTEKLPLLDDLKAFLLSPKNLTNQENRTDTKVLLTVSRLVKRKGHDIVIKSLPKVMEKFPNIVYVIVGEGPEKSHLENLVKENNLTNVIFNVADDKLKELYYQMADIFIMPSRDIKGDVEGFGIVFLEAALYGKPVIAGRSGGAGEAVLDKETGILVDPENSDEIAEAIVRLLNNPDLANKLGIQGKKRVEKEFSWEEQIKKIIKLLI